MTGRADLSKVSDEQLKDEFRSRGYALSLWSKEDIVTLVEDDEDCADLSDEQVEEVAQRALGEMGSGLEDILGSRGNEYTADRWYGDVKETVLASIKAATPKA